MNILSIETSCDETGVSLVSCNLTDDKYSFDVRSDNLLSQAKLHAEYGGVFPSLAKREHAKAIVPLIIKTLKEAGVALEVKEANIGPQERSSRLERAKGFLDREPEVAAELEQLEDVDTSTIDAIAITVGPGLAPALWVGVNTARALSELWKKPLIPVNHMHGHLFSALFPTSKMFETPALGLLVSGGHTEILKLNEDLSIEILGATRDDAIGEGFDKAARLLGLGYPGGALISKEAREHRIEHPDHTSKLLPRPMEQDDSLDVSYSGLKTALLYHIRDNPIENKVDSQLLAREFEDAALDVILSKVRKALQSDEYRSLTVGGGVIANIELRKRLELLSRDFSVPLYLPEQKLTTDNSLMIAVAAFVSIKNEKLRTLSAEHVEANANLGSDQFIK